MVGSLVGRGDDVLPQVLPFLALGLLLAAVNAPALNTLQMGDDVARGLGARIGLARVCGIAAVTLLTGAAVCSVTSARADRLRRPGGAARRARGRGTDHRCR